MRYEAKQVDPACQYCDTWRDEVENGDINIYGNKYFQGCTSAIFDKAREFVELFENYTFDELGYTDKRACVYSYFGEYLQIDRKIYLTDSEIDKIMFAVEYSAMPLESRICNVLSGITQKIWAYSEIHGSTQGEWQGVYFNSSFNPQWLQELEMQYFNLGSEFVITDTDTMDEYNVYICKWNDSEIEDELQSIVGDEVDIYFFDGYETKCKYRRY